MYQPRTKSELWELIRALFNIELPWRAYATGHSSPFGFVADAFFHPEYDIAGWAPRSGGKTLGSSIIARLAYLFTEGLQCRVLSGSQDQANNLYEYWMTWAATIYPQQVSGKVNIHRTRINGGKFEILTASEKSVRGPKIQILFEDERDEIDYALTEAAQGMLAAKDGIPSRTIHASTWHRVGGSMGKLIAGCPDNGVRLHKWNLWECISQCGEERHEHGKNCGTCPLGIDCLDARISYSAFGGGDTKGETKGSEKLSAQAIQQGTAGCQATPGIAAEPFGIFAVEDAIKRYQKLSRETIDAEYLCKRPSPEGLVYPSFDPLKHKIDKRPDDLTIYRSIDWGYNCFVCLWLGMDKAGTVYVLDTYRAETAKVATNAKFILEHSIKNVRDTFCDPAGRNKADQTGRSSIDEFKSFGIHCRYRLDNRSRNVNNGIKLVRNYLNPAAGPPRLYYIDTPQNRVFATAMQSYINRKINDEWLDEPKDPQEYEHIPDALRYFFVNATQGPAVMSGRPGAS